MKEDEYRKWLLSLKEGDIVGVKDALRGKGETCIVMKSTKATISIALTKCSPVFRYRRSNGHRIGRKFQWLEKPE